MILENIKRKCHERGIGIPELEQAAKIGKNTIYKWGESSPSVEKLKAVADHFGCTVDELLREEKGNEEEETAKSNS